MKEQKGPNFNRLNYFLTGFSMLFIVLILGQISFAAQISGTVATESGDAGWGGGVWVYKGDPCDRESRILVAEFDPGPLWMGISFNYTIEDLPAGSYYVSAGIFNAGFSDVLPEFWAGTASSALCENATLITVGYEDVVTGIDFELSPGVMLRGEVYDNNGNSINSVISFFRGSPCNPAINHVYTAGARDYPRYEDGSFEIYLPPGEYYLKSQPLSNYVEEWWADPQSTLNCSQAQAIILTPGQDISGKNFQHDVPGGIVVATVVESGNNSLICSAIEAIVGDPCGNYTRIHTSTEDQSPRTIQGLKAGSYYIKASGVSDYPRENGRHSLVDEWWTGDGGSTDCRQAKTIDIAVGETVSGIHFQLEFESYITGYVSIPSSNNRKSAIIYAYSGDPCGNTRLIEKSYQTASEYLIFSIPAGTYFLKAVGDGLFTQEWWAGDQSSPDCHLAQPVVVGIDETVAGKNFQLDEQPNLTPINRLLLRGNR